MTVCVAEWEQFCCCCLVLYLFLVTLLEVLTPGYFAFRMERCKTLKRFDGPGWLNGYLETV